MKFLIDNALSPLVADGLKSVGHDAVHVRDSRRPEKQIKILLANLPNLAESLEKGCVVVFDQNRIRVRNLPIVGDGITSS